ncbi:MAG: hypothetical protein ACYDCL_17320 [Myxococcales bacterium]
MSILLTAGAWLALAASAAPAPPDGGVTLTVPSPKDKEGSRALWAVLGHFDEYPGATPYQLSDEMHVGAATLQMAGFATDDPPEKVIAFYRAEFAREKLFVPPAPPESIPFEGVTGFDPANELEKTVMVSPGNGGPTRVVLSVSPGKGLAPKALAPGGDPPAGLPLFAGSDSLYRTDAQDGLRTSSTVSYRAPGDPREVLDFIRKDLEGKGWVQAREQGGPGGGLRYQRGGEGVEVTLLPLGEKSTAVTYIYTH